MLKKRGDLILKAGTEGYRVVKMEDKGKEKKRRIKKMIGSQCMFRGKK